MPLIIDRTQSPPALDEASFRAWATTHTVFVSSEMGELKSERRAVADALRAIGVKVVMFEDLGGRDDDPETAYLDGVARSDIYVAIVADRYGRMLTSGRSPTHEEYLEARRRGLRIAAWVAADDSARQGHARDFVAELQVFHATGTYTTVSSLTRSIDERIREIAAEQDTPWVKLDEVIFRASSIEDDGRQLTVTAQTRDRAVASAIQALRPAGHAGSSQPIPVSFGDMSGAARVTAVSTRSASATLQELTISAEVSWADGRRSTLAASINGISPEQQIEVGLADGLFGHPLPDQLGMLAGTVDSSDPLEELDRLSLPHAIYEPVARLLIAGRLIATGATQIDVAVGPVRARSRPISVSWLDPRAYSNDEPARRQIGGERAVASA
ncbi:MAG TPA: DUF4062 domain-containing protein [Solirubrobacteraceae bacterium]|jgi:hypothetical protein|nr:DUF4062 domain-containing protein [Solirubrobacteraceae bacterium]